MPMSKPKDPPKVQLNEELAGWSAAYLAMWKALEVYDPGADRWSEPAPFGDAQERKTAAIQAIARVRERYPDPQREQDAAIFQQTIQGLEQGRRTFGPEEKELADRLRETGSCLADQSVTAANTAQR